MKTAGFRALALFAATACALVGSTGVALATTSGWQQAKAFAGAEVAYYAKGLPSSLQANPTSVGTTVDRNCFSSADNRVSPGTPAWHQRDALNQYCGTLRLRD